MKTTLIRTSLVLGVALATGCGAGAPADSGGPAPPKGPVDPYAPPAEETTGAVVSLGSEEESGGHFVSMVEMLRGRVAGLQVFESSTGEVTVRIRGLHHSIIASEDPLLVVDGMTVPSYALSNTLKTMNPADVSSIQVLKDVGSTSAYGTRGANGVILIRLKRR